MSKFSTLVAPVMFSKTREKLVANPNLSFLNILTSLLQVGFIWREWKITPRFLFRREDSVILSGSRHP
jgi:hypothetical protein